MLAQKKHSYLIIYTKLYICSEFTKDLIYKKKNNEFYVISISIKSN